MKDRNLIGAGIVAVVAAVCCAAPLLVMLVTTVGAAGLTAWLAKAGNVLVPALILGAAIARFVLYRKQRRER
jgi:mercuric ion transport protein